ncbi:hypothetical protein Bca52824_090409 [Brassica carinata]|uniref:Small ribosomal subunit protein uS4 N-terminal domain-containing protein n=1 Tax=Brassica carinata TaxID=52824 RepID=A0A8X7NYQ9_BRACI|nr:hypothetical protein Bca52824_090409 [Brassica carinata]
MRKLKFHEKKIIRKTNFLEWKREGGHRENLITNRYHMGLCRMMQKQTNVMKQMDPTDPFRIQMTDLLLETLYNMGTVLVHLKYAEHLTEAVAYIEQGHIRVGPDTITDPAFLVTRNMEDFITWG